jgi:carbamoyltransferase
MKILGVSLGHDASLALVIDGVLITAISAERIKKIKKTPYIDWEVIDYVLHPNGLTIDDIDLISIGAYSRDSVGFITPYYPEDKMFAWPFGNLNPKFNSLRGDTNFIDGAGYDVFVNNQFYPPLTDYTAEDFVYCNVLIDGKVVKPGIIVNHHMAHASSVHYTSNFDKSLIFSLDASGIKGNNCSAFIQGDGNRLNYLGSPDCMIGNFYNCMTELLSYGPGLTKAGTLMGAASYGKPNEVALNDWEWFATPMHNRPTLEDDVTWNVNAASKLTQKPYTKLRSNDANDWEIYKNRTYNWTYGNYIISESEKSDTPEVFNMAASVQYVFEKTVLKYIDELYDNFKHLDIENLCLVGGSFLNCTANYKVLKNMKFKNLFIYPACGDDGTSVGAALYASYYFYDETRQKFNPVDLAYCGNFYQDLEVGLDYDEDTIAKMLSDSKIVAWFDGNSEFGPRALGHRSFLANPTDPKIKDILNKRVKHREWFRPFAPIVLKEKTIEWFDIDVESPFMLFTCPVKQPWRVPGITHVDGTARVQTLSKDTNSKLYSLIEKFESYTGVPIVLNTSLNVNGQPIVETPEDALKLFESSDIDAIVINNKMFIK